MKRTVHSQLSLYLFFKIDPQEPEQFAFRASHSTATALLPITETLCTARSINCKTFLLHPSGFLLGINAAAGQWFASYLDVYLYQVTQRELTSALQILSSGVPQDSVLGPFYSYLLTLWVSFYLYKVCLLLLC